MVESNLAADAVADAGSQRTLHVLLVEGDEAEARRIELMLAQTPARHRGAAVRFQVHRATDPAEAIAHLEGSPADLLLLSLPMPGSDTDPAAGPIAMVHAAAPRVPIILLTAHEPRDVNDDLSAAVQMGIQDTLVRTWIDGQLLAHAIRYAIERHRAEEALAEQRNLLRTLIDALPDYIYVKDRQSRFVLNNLAHVKVLGFSDPQQVVGRSDFESFPPELAQRYYDDEQALMASDQPLVDRQEPYVDASGATRWLSTTKVPLHDRHGQVIGLVGLSRDFTEHRRFEEQLRAANAELAGRKEELERLVEQLKASHEELIATQMQLVQMEKMQSLGRLAAGIAHEVRNPLGTVRAAADFLQATLGPQAHVEDTAMALRAIQAAVRKADDVIRGLMDFSRPSRLEARPQPLNPAVEQALALVAHQLVRAEIQVVRELAPDLPEVCIDTSKIEQALVNLFLNAAHAMPGGGTLTVRTAARRHSEAPADPPPDVARPPWPVSERFQEGQPLVVIEVEDTGAGIPADKLPRLFEPFFTTKAPGKGTGLGLSVTRTIVQLHGGDIQITNRREGGVRVILSLKVGH